MARKQLLAVVILVFTIVQTASGFGYESHGGYGGYGGGHGGYDHHGGYGHDRHSSGGLGFVDHKGHGGYSDDDHHGGYDDHHGGYDDHHGGYDDHHDSGYDDHHDGGYDDHHGGYDDHDAYFDDHHGGYDDHHGGYDDHDGHHGGGYDDHYEEEHDGYGHHRPGEVGYDTHGGYGSSYDRYGSKKPYGYNGPRGAFGHKHDFGWSKGLGYGGIKNPLNVLHNQAYKGNYGPGKNFGAYGGYYGTKNYAGHEINKYRLRHGLHALNPDDLDGDGEPDHLTATKHKIDDYLAKQWKLGRRKLTVQVQYGNMPLEYQYLNQFHKFPNPVAGTPLGSLFGLPTKPQKKVKAPGNIPAYGVQPTGSYAPPTPSYGTQSPPQKPGLYPPSPKLSTAESQIIKQALDAKYSEGAGAGSTR
eukprot:TRINITY_DN3326_c0_g2_i2.p1 TRINITY_DN3326_c0_g2~~TRINITY_DN3326_c0_g2_i2.p1  ORF type:complete len:413 (-),score=65.59 TRINITY_DN3326_c0_g2_i2:113-1351(-)